MKNMKRTRLRLITQYSQSECGLCSLGMVLDYHGNRQAISDLRKRIDTGRDGLSLSRIADLAREFGCDAKIYRANLKGLIGAEMPLIVFWQNRHVVVLEKIDERRATILDPAQGRRVLSISSFDEGYSGYAINVRPGPRFTIQKNRNNRALRELSQVVKTTGIRGMLAVGMLSLVLYAATLAIPISIQMLVDGIIGNSRVYSAMTMFALVGIPAVLYLMLSLLRTVLLSTIVGRLGKNLMSHVYQKLVSLPYSFHSTRSEGELITRLGSVSQIRDLISNQITASVLDLGVAISAIGYLLYAHTELGWATLGMVMMIGLINILFWSPLRGAADEELRYLGTSAGVQYESVASFSAIKTSGMIPNFVRNWDVQYDLATRVGIRRMRIQGYMSGLVGTVQLFGPFGVLLFGIWLFVSGQGGLGAAIAAQTLCVSALSSVSSLSATVAQFVRAQAQFRRIGDILAFGSDSQWGSFSERIAGDVQLTDVSFTYPGARKPALDGVTLSVKAGECAAIVGASGSGKSTIAKLLVGLYSETAGAVLYDGYRRGHYSESIFRKMVSYVPQDVRLSNRTIAENVDFTGDEPDRDLVIDALRVAAIIEEVRDMPLGIDTEVRELGGNISGGQRQRLAIARAVCKSPSVLILDEATSALDSATENRVSNSLAELSCTRIVIAHRLSTVQNADIIFVVEGGRIVSQGKYDELLESSDLFRSLVLSGDVGGSVE